MTAPKYIQTIAAANTVFTRLRDEATLAYLRRVLDRNQWTKLALLCQRLIDAVEILQEDDEPSSFTRVHELVARITPKLPIWGSN